MLELDLVWILDSAWRDGSMDVNHTQITPQLIFMWTKWILGFTGKGRNAKHKVCLGLASLLWISPDLTPRLSLFSCSAAAAFIFQLYLKPWQELCSKWCRGSLNLRKPDTKSLVHPGSWDCSSKPGGPCQSSSWGHITSRANGRWDLRTTSQGSSHWPEEPYLSPSQRIHKKPLHFTQLFF